jgi:hypothetical protein
MSEVICELCETKLIYKKDLSKHQKTEKCKTISKIINSKINKYIETINILNITNNKLNDELNNIKKELNEKINETNLFKIRIEEISNKSEEYRKLLEKAATKTTNTSIKNYNHNNYLNLISQEPIRFCELNKQLKQFVNCESLMYDENDFHEHIVDNILKDENGKDKILCTDINRKNFSYKDETSGELISDPELERLRDKLKKGADIKSVKKELLNKLIEQYENTEIDPYVKFYDILKKLDFGNPFVDHIAKKTYIKTKSILNIE